MWAIENKIVYELNWKWAIISSSSEEVQTKNPKQTEKMKICNKDTSYIVQLAIKSN